MWEKPFFAELAVLGLYVGRNGGGRLQRTCFVDLVTSLGVTARPAGKTLEQGMLVSCAPFACLTGSGHQKFDFARSKWIIA
jgi:hypothetical protein